MTLPHIDLKITADDIIAMGAEIGITIGRVVPTDLPLSGVGGQHTELRGFFVRQVPIADIGPIVRDVVLSEISNLLLVNGAECSNVDVRVWPEAKLTGKNGCIVKWYTRLSVYPARAMVDA
jgi:hypothetical protein